MKDLRYKYAGLKGTIIVDFYRTRDTGKIRKREFTNKVNQNF